MVPDQMLRKYFEATERDASTSKSVCTSSKYSLSIKVFNAEMPLLTRLSEKRHLRGTSFQTLRDNNNRFKQLLSAVPSISIIQPLENVWLFQQTPSCLLQSNAPRRQRSEQSDEKAARTIIIVFLTI